MHPTIFQIGSFKLASFGVMMVLALLAGLVVARKRAPAHGITAEQVADVSFWLILAGILGSRLFFVAQEYKYYFSHLNELLTVQFQGLTSFGGFIVGSLVAAYVCKRKGISPLTFLDVIAPAFLLGHAIGRIGCLLNGCCHGAPAKIAFPFAAYSAENKQYNVPAQLYDSAMNIVALFVLLWLEKRYPRQGFAFGMMMILHGFARFIYEFFRAGASSTTIGGSPLTEGHVMALVIMVVGAVFAFRNKKAVVEA
jgi:phosphatidylglycerol---prolipoprotein diacylglyceryl transferase